jgi:hypothetical protein
MKNLQIQKALDIIEKYEKLGLEILFYPLSLEIKYKKDNIPIIDFLQVYEQNAVFKDTKGIKLITDFIDEVNKILVKEELDFVEYLCKIQETKKIETEQKEILKNMNKQKEQLEKEIKKLEKKVNNFKDYQIKFSINQSIAETLLQYATKVWNDFEGTSQQFPESFVASEYFENQNYWFYIGDLHMNMEQWKSAGKQFITVYLEKLQKHLLQHNIQAALTIDRYVPDEPEDNYTGSGWVVILMEDVSYINKQKGDNE